MALKKLTLTIDVPDVHDACWSHPDGGATQCLHDVALRPAKIELERRLLRSNNPTLSAYLEAKLAVLASVTIKLEEAQNG